MGMRYARLTVVIVLLGAGLLSPHTCIAQPVPQAIHEEYTAKIKEYTTEKFFLTELVGL
jgi:hypothetical protein